MPREKLPECRSEDLLSAAEHLDAFPHSDNPADRTKKISFTKVAAMLRKTVSVRERETRIRSVQKQYPGISKAAAIGIIERSAKPSVK